MAAAAPSLPGVASHVSANWRREIQATIGKGGTSYDPFTVDTNNEHQVSPGNEPRKYKNLLVSCENFQAAANNCFSTSGLEFQDRGNGAIWGLSGGHRKTGEIPGSEMIWNHLIQNEGKIREKSPEGKGWRGNITGSMGHMDFLPRYRGFQLQWGITDAILGRRLCLLIQ